MLPQMFGHASLYFHFLLFYLKNPIFDPFPEKFKMRGLMKMPLMKNGKTDSMTAPCSRFVGLEMPFTKYRETPVSGVDYIKVGRTA